MPNDDECDTPVVVGGREPGIDPPPTVQTPRAYAAEKVEYVTDHLSNYNKSFYRVVVDNPDRMSGGRYVFEQSSPVNRTQFVQFLERDCHPGVAERMKLLMNLPDTIVELDVLQPGGTYKSFPIDTITAAASPIDFGDSPVGGKWTWGSNGFHSGPGSSPLVITADIRPHLSNFEWPNASHAPYLHTVHDKHPPYRVVVWLDPDNRRGRYVFPFQEPQTLQSFRRWLADNVSPDPKLLMFHHPRTRIEQDAFAADRVKFTTTLLTADSPATYSDYTRRVANRLAAQVVRLRQMADATGGDRPVTDADREHIAMDVVRTLLFPPPGT